MTILHVCLHNFRGLESVDSETKEQRLKNIDVYKRVKSIQLISHDINALQSENNKRVDQTSKNVLIDTGGSVHELFIFKILLIAID